MKNSVMKRTITLMLSLVLLLSTIPMVSITAFAASAWPSFSSARYCEMIAPRSLSVYRDTSLKTRGTYSPAKSYNASVAKNDKIYILKCARSYTKVSYPTSSGRRIGYVKTNTLFGVNVPTETVKCKSKVTTYTTTSISRKSGNTAVNDTVLKLGTTKNGFVLIMYTAKFGSRSMKAAFVTKSDYTKIVKGSSSASFSGTQNMSYALYKSSGGRLTCGFNGYNNTEGYHEGIDFKKGRGNSVYSLTDGVITRVTEGYRGKKGLSTIAIYSASTGKTVVYLHTDPVNSLYVGQQIYRGQLIAYEDWRGCSTSSGAHTHVEMREGRRTAAAKSIDDYTLENPNPTEFWNSQGYQVR